MSFRRRLSDHSIQAERFSAIAYPSEVGGITAGGDEAARSGCVHRKRGDRYAITSLISGASSAMILIGRPAVV